MMMLAFFTNRGTPVLGLSPTIDIWESDGTQVITAQAMTEVAGGWYSYLFAGYDPTKSYGSRADGGAALPSLDRYRVATNESRSSADASIAAYDPPTKAELDTHESNIRGGPDTLDSISDQIDAVQTDLDNPGQYQADVSTLALETTAALIRKLLTNRQELAAGSVGNFVTYDDDDTVLLTQDVTDESGGVIAIESGIPARRTKGV